MDLFTLSATLGLNREAYTKGLKAAQGEAQSFVSKGIESFSNFARLGAAKLADMATTGVKDLVTASVQTGQTFDSAMAQVAATMGKTVDQLSNETGTVQLEWGEFSGNLRDYAREMGANTQFSATEAAQALNYMALAGYDTQEAMSMLPNVLNLAAAGGMELATASDMITDAQTALGLSFEETTKMVDQMAVTSQKSNTSVSQLGDAILTIGAYARNVAGGTQELNTVLGALADNGIKGSTEDCSYLRAA